MSFELVGLGRLLGAIYATEAQRTSILRDDIRRELKKASGFSNSKGGDFYGPFWADAKKHVSGGLDLRFNTPLRIASNDTRQRLYPLLAQGFLLWWEEKRRLRNVPFKIIEGQVIGRYAVHGVGMIKVENTLTITVGDDGHRIIYPYFIEDPSLGDEAARLGLWVMSQCVRRYAPEDMRVLDIIRGRSFSVLDTPLRGDEEAILALKYAQVLDRWRELRGEYA